MFTLFDLLRLIGFLGGAFVGGSLGWEWLGVFGLVLGGAGGFFVGGFVGQLPLICALKFVSRKFDAMTSDDLRQQLHAPDCLAPNVLLLELRRRGEDIQSELTFLHSLLVSDEMFRRTAGWAALTSAFPELVHRIPNYNPTGTPAECRKNCELLEESNLVGLGPPS